MNKPIYKLRSLHLSPRQRQSLHALRQLVYFGVIGITINALGYLLYLFLTSQGINPKNVVTVFYFIGTILTFLLNKSVTFSYKGRSNRAFWRFLLAYGFGYFVNLSGLIIGVDWLEFPHQLVQAVMIIVVGLMLFILQKLWVFRSHGGKR